MLYGLFVINAKNFVFMKGKRPSPAIEKNNYCYYFILSLFLDFGTKYQAVSRDVLKSYTLNVNHMPFSLWRISKRECLYIIDNSLENFVRSISLRSSFVTHKDAVLQTISLHSHYTLTIWNHSKYHIIKNLLMSRKIFNFEYHQLHSTCHILQAIKNLK